MSGGILNIARAAVVSAILSIVLAACNSSIAVERASGSQSLVAWSAARPHVLRAKLDTAGGTIWALHADGIDVHDATSDERIRSIRLPGWIWAADPGACPPDFLVAPDGDVLVTSNVVPVIWRIDAARFEVTRHDVDVEDHRDRDIGFAGLAARDGAWLAVGAHDNSLWRIDSSLTRAKAVGVSSPMPGTCGVSDR
jgi:hypothetical protein